MTAYGDDEYSSRQIRLAFLDWKVWLYMMIQFCGLTPVFCISSFLPSIIKGMGFENVMAQLLTVPPYLVASIIQVFSSWLTGRLKERSNHLLVFLLIGITGFLYLILSKKVLYVGAFMACTGVFSSNALILPWATSNIGGKTKRAVAIALIAASGGIGGVVSGQIYRDANAPYYHQGHAIMLGIMSCNFILVLLLKLLLKHENRRRENLSPEERQAEIVGDGINPSFDKVKFADITAFLCQKVFYIVLPL